MSWRSDRCLQKLESLATSQLKGRHGLAVLLFREEHLGQSVKGVSDVLLGEIDDVPSGATARLSSGRGRGAPSCSE